MVKKTVVPDAWEDDWETQADSIPPEEQSQAPEASVSQTQPQTKEERLARHAESNRKIWESAYAHPALPSEHIHSILGG